MSVNMRAKADRGRRSRALPGGNLTNDRPGADEKKGAHGGNMVFPVGAERSAATETDIL